MTLVHVEALIHNPPLKPHPSPAPIPSLPLPPRCTSSCMRPASPLMRAARSACTLGIAQSYSMAPSPYSLQPTKSPTKVSQPPTVPRTYTRHNQTPGRTIGCVVILVTVHRSRNSSKRRVQLQGAWRAGRDAYSPLPIVLCAPARLAHLLNMCPHSFLEKPGRQPRLKRFKYVGGQNGTIRV
jgi:hypothetical protein